MAASYTLAVEAGRAAARAATGDKLAAFYRAAGAAFFAPTQEPAMSATLRPYRAPRAETTGDAIDRAERAIAALRTLKNETRASFPGEHIDGAGSLMDDAPDAMDAIESKLRAVLARLNAMPEAA